MVQVFPSTAARIRAWRERPEVLGVLQVGSRSRGHGDELSDDDLEVILTEEAFLELRPADTIAVEIEGEGPSRRIIYDALYMPLSDLERKPASPLDLDHWPYERAPIHFDRDGRVGAAVKRAAAMDETFQRERIRNGALDAWVAVHRSAKTRRRGFEASARLIVARGVRALSRVLFALEARWVPLDHWFEAELKTLSDPFEVGPRLLQAMRAHDPEPIKEGLEALGEPLVAEGFPLEIEGRRALFLELIHPSNRESRAVHGMF